MSTDDLKRLKPKYPNQELNVVIPLGVSVNHLYMFKRGRRFMTKKGEKYMKDVMLITSRSIDIPERFPNEVFDISSVPGLFQTNDHVMTSHVFISLNACPFECVHQNFLFIDVDTPTL